MIQRSHWLLPGGLAAVFTLLPQSAVAQAAPKLTDPEIAAVVVAANQIDAEFGDFAVSRSQTASVQSFGRSVAVDHRAVIKTAGALLERLGVTPAENAVSRSLRSDAAAARGSLEKKHGRDFDAAYVAHEIAYHRAVIDAIDQVLLPAATNPELKATIEKVRPALEAHLHHAEQIEKSLKAVP